MDTRDILKNLREKKNLTQEALAERIHVTRQAISRLGVGGPKGKRSREAE